MRTEASEVPHRYRTALEKFGPAPHNPDAESLKGERVIARGKPALIVHAFFDIDVDAMRCWVKFEGGTSGWIPLSEIELL